jgi:hypothetical protein
MHRLLSTLVCFLLLTAGAAVAREQSDAPDIEILGFSADGRYFAYEQYGYDLASDALDAAIFVIDRQTTQAAQGFPFGFISIEQDGNYPARVGGHDIDLEALRTEDGTPDLGQVRKLVRDKAAAKLAALAIGTQGRRLAGVPLTQRSPANDKAAPLKFTVRPTIPSAIPDQQLTYGIDAKLTDVPQDCVNAMPPAREQHVTFEIVAERTYPETKTVATKDFPFSWAMEKDTCPIGLWISDIIAAPDPDASQDRQTLVVIFLTTAWSSAVDSAQYHATFIETPEAKE